MLSDEQKKLLKKEYRGVNSRANACLVRFALKQGMSEREVRNLFDIGRVWFKYLVKLDKYLEIRIVEKQIGYYDTHSNKFISQLRYWKWE